MFFFASTSLTSLVFALMSMGFCGWAMKNNAAYKKIDVQLLGLMLSVACSSSLGMVAVLYPYLDSSDSVAAKQELINRQQELIAEMEQRDSRKSLPRYLDVLHEKASQEFGEEFVTLFQEDLRYVIVKKIDFIKSGKSKGLNKLAKSDCDQVFKATSNGQVNFPPIDIRYIDTGKSHTKRFQCDQIALLESDRPIKPVQ